MTASHNASGSGKPETPSGESSPARRGVGDGPPDRRPRSRRDRRIRPDGGEAQAERPADAESSPDEGDDEDEATETADESAEEAQSGEDEPAESDGEEAANDEEAADDEEAVEPESGHAADAETVYESEDAANVAHLDLDGLFLDVLGLEVNLNEVTLDVSARPGESNLLGNLLSSVSSLLDGPSALASRLSSMLGAPKKAVTKTLGSLKSALLGLLGKPGAFLRNRLGGEAPDGKPEADAEPEVAEAEADEGGRLSAAVGWLKERLVAIVPGLPIEELIATVVREVLRGIVEQLERATEDEEPAQPQESPSQAEA